MQTFKTSKCELLFISAPNKQQREKIGTFCTDKDVKCKVVRLGLYGADSAKPFLNFNAKGCVIYNVEIPEGYTLLGPISTITEDVAKGLVDECTTNHYPSTSKWYQSYADRMCHQTAWLALQNIAHHLGMNTNDNIYILKRK